MINIEDILGDYTHGSTYLAKRYLELVIQDQPSQKELDEMQKQILSRFNDMQIFHQLYSRLKDTSDPIKEAQEQLERLTQSGDILSQKLQAKVNKRPRFLTISYSNAVVDTMTHMRYEVLYCMRSVPGGEGVDLTNDLDHTVLVEDDEIDGILRNVDVVIFGCDQYDDKYITNKIGTKNLAKKARDLNIPIYVLTSKLKQVDQINLRLNDPMLENFERDKVTQVITD